MESSDDGDPGPGYFRILTRISIPQRSILIRALQVEEPYTIMNERGKPVYRKAGDTRVEVLQESADGTKRIQWLEREWHSKSRTNNFMKAYHYTQHLELALKRPEFAVTPEVVDRDLVRKVL